MVGFQRDPWSLLPWTFLKFQTTQNLKWLFAFVLGNSQSVRSWSGRWPPQVPAEARESISPLSLPPWQSKRGHVPWLCLWTSPTWTQNQEQMRQRQRVVTTHLQQSDIKHWRLGFRPPERFLQLLNLLWYVLLPFTRSSSPQPILRTLCVTDALFWCSLVWLIFLFWSGRWLREQEATSFVCNKESLPVPNGRDQMGVHLPWKVVGRSALANWSINSISQEEVLLFSLNMSVCGQTILIRRRRWADLRRSVILPQLT